MRLDELKPAPGSKHRRKIVGRGVGSGHGGQSTRGMKGQRSRAGWSGMTGFEGGQMPMIRRIPKRGFRRGPWRETFAVVNVGEFETRYAKAETISPESLELSQGQRLKVLGDGDLKKAIKVQAHAFSASAQEKIKKAGGSIEILKK
jgi:large subunit ribosomal protein L15